VVRVAMLVSVMLQLRRLKMIKFFKKLFRKKRSSDFTGFEVRFYQEGKLMSQHFSMAKHWFHNYYHVPVKLSENECLMGYRLEPILNKAN
jgi:hypothetical protein